MKSEIDISIKSRTAAIFYLVATILLFLLGGDLMVFSVIGLEQGSAFGGAAMFVFGFLMASTGVTSFVRARRLLRPRFRRDPD